MPAWLVFPHVWDWCIYSKTPKRCSACICFQEKRWHVLSFKSSRRVFRMKNLGRRRLDLRVLAETPGSHWFLTRQLGRCYNKMHYNQPHVSSDTLTSLSLPRSSLLAGLCVCVHWDGHSSRPSYVLFQKESYLLGLLTSETCKCWQDISYLAFPQTHSGIDRELGGTSVFFNLRQRQRQIKTQLLKGIKFIL